jgi:hypothetical protein
MKHKQTIEAWQELVKQRQAQSVKNNQLASNANHAHAIENEKEIKKVRHDVYNARYKFKNRPYGKSAAQRMANAGQLHKYQPFGYNDYCRFERGKIGHVVKVCGEPYTIMLPAKKGSGSRGSRFINK